MLFEGVIVRTKNTKGELRLRVPYFDEDTAESKLPVPKISSSAGITPDLPNGVKVLVCYGNYDISDPIIVSLLPCDNYSSIKSSATFTDLKVDNSVKLSTDINFVTVDKKSNKEKVVLDWNNIKTLEGQTKKLTEEFSEIDKSIDSLNTHKSDEAVHMVDGALLGMKKLTITESMYGSSLPKDAVDGQVFLLLEE